MRQKFFSDRVLASSFIIGVVLVALEVSAWIAVFSFFILSWKWASENYGFKGLSRRWTGALSVVLLVQVLFQFRTLVGQEPAYTFLLALSSLRVMDYENERDRKFVILLGFMLISVKSLFSLDIYWLLPSVLAFAGLWYSLLPPQIPEKTKLLGKIFLRSLPLAILLFFAFPRLVIPWAMSRGGGAQGEIGFSDEINPGQVASLATNSALAFRAKMNDLPKQASRDLYWRGSVLTESAGLSWRPGRAGLREPVSKPQRSAFYEVAIEPTSRMYLFTLDGTQDVELDSSTVIPLQRSVFRSSRPLAKAAVYRGSWAANFTDRTLPTEEDLVVVPAQGRVAIWLDSIRAKKLSEQGILEELQNFFSREGFLYSLTPGVYTGPDDLEEFLFERKKGFCEHFAGAYATLARSLGVPARVVVGYQGGLYNPWGDFWKISQKDAHAWVEVFSAGVWQRVDPVKWVAPLRLEIGAEDFFSLSEADQRAFAHSIDWRPSKQEHFLAWDQISFWIENVNYRWNYFLIDFDRGAQQSLWKRFFDFKAQTLLGGLFIVLLLVFIFRSLLKPKENRTEEQALIRTVELWAARKGLYRGMAEPPLQFLDRVSDRYPLCRGSLTEILQYYDAKVYAQQKNMTGAKEILERWKSTVLQQESKEASRD